MHYTVGQEVYGGHIIIDIVETDDKYIIYIEKNSEVKQWKSFNKHMGISVEDNINFESDIF